MTDADILRRSREINLRLAESALDIFSGYGTLYGQDFYDGGAGNFGAYGGSIPPLWAQSQKRGEVIPVYLNEIQLRRIRDRSRRLCQESGYAICAVENLKNYVVGKGLVYRAVSKRPDMDLTQLLVQVNSIIELFRHANNLRAWESDTVLRWARDGEIIIRCFEMPSGLMLLRPVEAEHLRSPIGDAFGPEYTLGIQTLADDIMTIQGYWIVEQPIVSPLPRFVPAEEVVHSKINTDISAKRGLPIFYPIEANFRRAEDLLVSMTSLAKQRAKIAMIRKLKGMAQSAASALTQSLTDISVTDPTTSNQVNFERMRPGTILTSPDGIEYEYPAGDIAASDYVAVLECELRSICARMNWPDWMLTSNAGAASFASGLIAEAPSTRMFERMQAEIAQLFGECAFPGKESLIWRQLRIAIKRGVLPVNLDELIEVQVECPTLVVRDKAQEATVNQTYLETKIKSPQTVQQEQGLDSEQEARNWEEWERSHPQQQPALPGMPGMPHDGGNGEAGGNANPGEQRPPGPGGPQKQEGMRESVWDEDEHPRASDGKFGSGGSKTSKAPEKPPKSREEDEHGKFRGHMSGNHDPLVSEYDEPHTVTRDRYVKNASPFLSHMSDSPEADAAIHHRDAVEKALLAGKPVPAHVLADYPKLAARHGTTAPVAKDHARVQAINTELDDHWKERAALSVKDTEISEILEPLKAKLHEQPFEKWDQNIRKQINNLFARRRKVRTKLEAVDNAIKALDWEKERLHESMRAAAAAALRENVKDDTGHEHASDGKFTGNGGGGGAATKEKPSANKELEKPTGDKKALTQKAKEILTKAGQIAGKAEHAVVDAVEKKVESLPDLYRKPIKGVYNVAMLSYSTAQGMVQAVAEAKGLSPDKASKLASTLAGVDVLLAKPAVIACESFHLDALATLVAGFTPIASSIYLGYSAATSPIATIKAASGIVTILKKSLFGSGKKTVHESASTDQNTLDSIGEFLKDLDDTQTDWFMALLSVALDQSEGDLATAFEVAKQGFADNPTQPEGE